MTLSNLEKAYILQALETRLDFAKSLALEDIEVSMLAKLRQRFQLEVGEDK